MKVSCFETKSTHTKIEIRKNEEQHQNHNLEDGWMVWFYCPISTVTLYMGNAW